MADKLTYSLHEIALMVGVSKDTVRRRMEPIKELLEKGQRKRFYNPLEVELIKAQFYNEVKGI